MDYTVGIIGGGASGMVAAIIASQRGERVLLLEKNAILGKKILATGNGRCNFSNRSLSVGDYDTDDTRKLEGLLTSYPTQRIVDFFRDIGVESREKNGYLYPSSEQASTVRDLLEARILELSVTVRTACTVEQVSYRKQDRRFVIQAGAETFTVPKLILAGGGLASPGSGSDGSCLLFAKQLGIETEPTYPALTGLIAKENYCRSLKGVRAQGCVWLAPDNRVKGFTKDTGEIQLTEYGISGIPVFQISGTANRILSKEKEVRSYIDFLQEKDAQAIREMAHSRYLRFAGRPLGVALDGIVHKKLTDAAILLSGLKADEKVERLQETDLLQVLKTLKKFPFTIVGSKDYEQAQVTRGGVRLKAVTDALESKQVPGLFFCGEILNADGKCGGYNLHFAWASGMAAGRLGESDA